LFVIAMWCTRWFLPLLLLPLPTAPPYFLVLFLLTLALHARPCFYCIILLAALFLSSCYWQSFPLDAHLSVPWSNNITTFSEALNATLPPHLNTLEFVSPVVHVADRCWCDLASGLFEPYDVHKWERDSIQEAVSQIEKHWKQSLKLDSDVNTNTTATAEPLHPPESSPPPNISNIQNETFSSMLRSFFNRRLNKSEPSTIFISPVVSTTPTEKPLAVESLIIAEPLLTPGQLDMRPFGFEVIFDFRWSRKS